MSRMIETYCNDCGEELTKEEFDNGDLCFECSDKEDYECPDLSEQGNTFGTFIK